MLEEDTDGCTRCSIEPEPVSQRLGHRIGTIGDEGRYNDDHQRQEGDKRLRRKTE